MSFEQISFWVIWFFRLESAVVTAMMALLFYVTIRSCNGKLEYLIIGLLLTVGVIGCTGFNFLTWSETP